MDLELFKCLFKICGDYKQAYEIFLYKLTGGTLGGIKRKLQNSFPSSTEYYAWVNQYKKGRKIYSHQEYSEEDVAYWKTVWEEEQDRDLVIKRLRREDPDKYRTLSIDTTLVRIQQSMAQGVYSKWKTENVPSKSRAISIGDNLGRVVKNIFMKFCQKKNLDAGVELRAYTNTLKHPDNSIFNAELVKNEKITIIHIDYTMSLNRYEILKKCYREYQGENRLLVIVVRSDMDIDLSKYKIPFSYNVKFMNYRDFADAMGYEGDFLNDYLDAWETAINAYPVDNEDAFNYLEKLANNAKDNLENSFPDKRTYTTQNHPFDKFLNLQKFLPWVRQRGLDSF